MIYGDPIILGGGGGGLDPSKPLIHVNAPLGSAVYITSSGGVIVPIPSSSVFQNVDGETADYYYSCPSTGTYTVTATLGGKTASDTVTVSEAKQYDVPIDYRAYIIKAGYIQTGFSLTYNLRSGYPVNFTENYNDGGFARVYTNGTYAGGFVTQQIDVSNYSKLVLDAQSENNYGNINLGVYGAASYASLDAIHAGALAEIQMSPNITRFQSELNITAISQNGYAGVCIRTANYSNVPLRVFNLWLE